MNTTFERTQAAKCTLRAVPTGTKTSSAHQECPAIRRVEFMCGVRGVETHCKLHRLGIILMALELGIHHLFTTVMYELWRHMIVFDAI